MTSFENAWRRYWQDTPPQGQQMRVAGKEHWLRFHALPQSKRYAGNEQEMQTLLARFNALADEVLGANRPCWLAQSFWNPEEERLRVPEAEYWVCRDHGLAPAFAFTYREPRDPARPHNQEDAEPYLCHAVQTTWRSGAFDPLFRAIAEQNTASLIWMSESGSVFAPYDSGVDLFLRKFSAYEELKTRRADWLSSHPSGL